MSAPQPSELSSQVLEPLLLIRGLSTADRSHVEQLIRDTERAAAQLSPDAPGTHLELSIERVQKVLAQARAIVVKYAD